MPPRSSFSALSLLLLCACGPLDPEAQRGTPGATKGDNAGSCVGVCGDQSPGGCWCDDLCAGYGDCCADKAQVCDGAEPPADPLAFYLGWQAARDQLVTAAEGSFGVPFEQIDQATYRAWLQTLDLTSDDGLMTWSQVAGIVALAVTETSDVFYYNCHLLADGDVSVMSYAELSALTTSYDPTTGQLTITDADGQARQTIPLAPGVIRPIDRTSSVSHNAGFAMDTVSYETLAPYLAVPGDVANREAIASALEALPLVLVKVLRGKGLFLSTQWGRSYAASSPLSNEIYEYFAGLVPGAFFERNSTHQTPRTLIHELCHLLDHTVIGGHYGSWYYPHQFPAFAQLAEDKARVFGDRGSADLPWDGAHGYVSSYARTNAQENFAEHCMAYIWEHEAFEQRAVEEASDGHPMLADKLAFIEKALGGGTSPERVLLSKEYVEQHLADAGGDGGGSDGGGSSCEPGQTQDECCLAALYEVSEIESLLGAVLAVGVSCEVSDPNTVPLDGGDYYYYGTLTCLAEATPDQGLLDSLTDTMAAEGYFGFTHSTDQDGQVTIHAQTSTRRCSYYD